MCAVDGCHRAYWGRVDGAGPGYCSSHYQRVKKYGAVEIPVCAVEWCDERIVGHASYCRRHRHELRSGGIVPSGYKRCSNPDCESPIQPTSAFSADKRRRSGLRSKCKTCSAADWSRHAEGYVERYASDPAIAKSRNATRYTDSPKSHHGLTGEQYRELLVRQSGKCAICHRAFDLTSGKSLTPHVDHDHACCNGPTSCGRCVRALLCARCNTFLGVVQDRVEILRLLKPSRARPAELIDGAIAYIEHWTAEMERQGLRQGAIDDSLHYLLSELGHLVKKMA